MGPARAQTKTDPQTRRSFQAWTKSSVVIVTPQVAVFQGIAPSDLE